MKENFIFVAKFLLKKFRFFCYKKLENPTFVKDKMPLFLDWVTQPSTLQIGYNTFFLNLYAGFPRLCTMYIRVQQL